MARKLLFLSIVFSFFILLSLTGATAISCWNYDGNQTSCEADSECEWIAAGTADEDWCTDATGCCEQISCWSYDGDQTACSNAINTLGMDCEWEPNDLNQNPWCPNDVGCCDEIGCWSRDGTNATYCEDSTFLNGICYWEANDPYCPDPAGCCHFPWCGSDDMQNETKCNNAADFGMPCSWSGSACIEAGCSANNNNTDGCFDLDWCSYNFTSGECYDPWTSGAGGGGFFNDFDVHCWFADDQPAICGNVTGCIYCNDTGTHNNVNGMSGTGNESSACYNANVGWCQGHEDYPSATDIAQDSLACSDILLKNTCNFGPLQGCKWNSTNTSVNQGNYCAPGMITDSEKEAFKPTFNGQEIKFCDDSLISGNETFCNQLANTWFMPCEWDNTSNSCIFDWESTGFGDTKGGDLDYYDIQDEDTCVMAGGKWVQEQYCSSGTVNIESWCEIGVGKGYEQCNDACWSCEWQDDGTDWANAAAAQSACEASNQGFCQWATDANAPNGYGWCDPKDDFIYGGGSCDSNCADCNAMNSPQTACTDSNADCEWVNDSTGSWCQGQNAMTCADTCDKCFDSSSCVDLGPDCSWDPTFFYCKTSGGGESDGEVCFDGMDNDKDGKLDCMDPDCSFDEFCGGGMMGDCHFYSDNTSCTNNGCSWISTEWEDWCGFPGENCWIHDDNATACQSETGCILLNSTAEGWDPFCEINETKAEPCWQETNVTICNANSDCTWVSDPWCDSVEGQSDPWCTNSPGWCDFFMFAQCFNQTDSTSCNANSNCIWEEDFYGMGGWCDPICFDLNSTACSTNSNCMLLETLCEPEMFAANCWQYDGNQTACDLQNTSCMYFLEPNGPDSDGVGGEPAGYCDPKGDMLLFQGMDPSPPIQLGGDAIGDATPDAAEVDITFFGLKEMGDAIGFGAGVDDIQDSVVCNGYYIQDLGSIGTGQNTTQFFLYLDTDGTETGGCSAYDQDGAAVAGFEFKLAYIAKWDTAVTGNVSEVKTFYTCTDDGWSVAAVPLFTDKPTMCNMIGGIMLGVGKDDLEQLVGYDSTIPARIFIATADATHNSTVPSDSASPSYYTPGTVDFKFECCDCPGQDIDGDGLTAEEDPDCEDFKKYGYILKEDCWSAEDDDNDGLINCADQDCMWEPKCDGAAGAYDPSNDNEAPKVVWHKVEVYPDGAFVMYDTNEPANGTVGFYYNDSACQTLNKTIRDIGLIDTYMPAYKDWHDGPIDNFQSNPDKLGFELINGTTYHYRLTLCDIAGNCGISACTNFTTAKSTSKSDCPACNPTFEFTPPTGFGFAFDFGSGWEGQGDACGGTGGIQISYNQTKKVNIKLNSSDGWEITLVNVTIPANLPDAAKVFEAADLKSLQSDSFVGMTKEKWEQLKSAGLTPQWIRIKFASSDCSELWHCDDTLDSCQQLDSEGGVTLISSAGGFCEWQLPPTWGFSTYGPSDGSATTTTTTTSSSTTSGISSGIAVLSEETDVEIVDAPPQTVESAVGPESSAAANEITGATVAEIIQQPVVQAGTLIVVAILVFAGLVYYYRHHHKPPKTVYRSYVRTRRR